MESRSISHYLPLFKICCLMGVILITSCSTLQPFGKFKMHYSGYISYDEEGKKIANPGSGIMIIDENELQIDPIDVFYIREIKCYQKKCIWENNDFIFILYWPHWKRRFVIMDKLSLTPSRVASIMKNRAFERSNWMEFYLTKVEFF